MTFHYVNLISWRFLIDRDCSNAHIYCDSISLKWLILFISGKKLNRNSGISEFHSLKEIKTNRINLLAHKVVNMEGLNYILPQNLSKFDFSLYQNIAWETVDTVFIGISSPKQDRIAYELARSLPHLNIYCFGAAMYTSTTSVDKVGLNWLLMAFKNPRRFSTKMLKTIREIVKILIDSQDRIKFKECMKELSDA